MAKNVLLLRVNFCFELVHSIIYYWKMCCTIEQWFFVQQYVQKTMGSVLSRVKFSFLTSTSSRIVYRAKHIVKRAKRVKQGEARYTILERVEVKKLNFTRDYWSHSELYILLKIVLCSIVGTFWKKVLKNTKFWVKSLKNCSSILFFQRLTYFRSIFSKQNRVVWSVKNKAS